MKIKPLLNWFPFGSGLAVLFFSLTLLIFSCVEEPVINDPVEEPPPYAALEKQIRDENDWRAVFTWDQYSQLMNVLSDKKFLVLPLNEMRNVYDSTVVVVGLRHDIDFHPFKALEMAEMEKHFAFRATYFVLADR